MNKVQHSSEQVAWISTRHRQGQQPSLLDLIFTLDPNCVDEVKYLSPLDSSDHVCLFVVEIQVF